MSRMDDPAREQRFTAPAPCGRRPSRRHARRIQAASLGLLGVAALAVPAIASAVNDPPALPHSIISFPQRDFVSAAGFQQSDAVTVDVIRNGITIGTSDAVAPQDDPKTPGFDGIVEVNHPGGGCWLTTTPDILPGDVVRTTVEGSGTQDQTRTANVTADAPANPAPGTIVVTGTAQSPSGDPLPLDEIEQRLVANRDAFDLNGRRTLRASAGSDGTLAYDSPASVHFTATYTGLSAADVTRALGAESRTLWLGSDPASGQEGTIYEHGVVGGPAAPCAAPAAVNGVTSSDHVFDAKPTINSLNAGEDLGLSGLAQGDVSAVSVTVRGPGNATTAQVSGTLSGGASGQTWSASIPSADVAGLADGTLTAEATFETADGSIGGSSLSLRKDTVAPGDPGATPGPGTYRAGQAVGLHGADPTATIHYTIDGSDPTGASPLTPAQLGVTSSLTIRAIAIDPAGNPSAVRSFAYVIEPPVATSGGATTATAAPAPAGATSPSIPAPKRAGGAIGSSSRPRLSVTSLRMAARVKQSSARRRGFRLTMRLPGGTEIVRIRVYRRTSTGLKLLSAGYRAPGAAGPYRIQQSHAQLRRRLTRGTYEVQVTPGYSRDELGATSKLTFRVV